VFSITLPLVEAKESDIVKVQSTEIRNVRGLAPGEPQYRILIVDDQYENQLLLARLMESAGFQIKIAENGAQGIELFQSWHPHFIWMDRRMPEMDGVEATTRIRELPEGKQVKIVAVTASALAEQRQEMLDAGMNDYVRKPYRASEIYHCLKKHLGVKYLYEDIPETHDQDLSLTPEMLNAVPKELLREFKEALENLESEHIEDVISRIAQQDERLQAKLGQLAENFDYPAILRALQIRESDC
jgi:CheY-like chemotaxis protein